MLLLVSCRLAWSCLDSLPCQDHSSLKISLLLSLDKDIPLFTLCSPRFASIWRSLPLLLHLLLPSLSIACLLARSFCLLSLSLSISLYLSLSLSFSVSLCLSFCLFITRSVARLFCSLSSTLSAALLLCNLSFLFLSLHIIALFL